MKNSTNLKNELIFEFAAGNLNMAKSLIASTYLFLNSNEANIYKRFETYCGEELNDANQIKPKNITAEDCMQNKKIGNSTSKKNIINPINNFIINFETIKWKKIFNGFFEYSFKLSKKENAKLIKMNPGTKVPLHSHNGKEYILVLDGSFSDEYGEYSKGDLQINDSQVKHTPIASKNNGCVCLTINEEDIVFFGPFSPILNMLTFLKNTIFSKK